MRWSRYQDDRVFFGGRCKILLLWDISGKKGKNAHIVG